jgi:hypothetical protein
MFLTRRLLAMMRDAAALTRLDADLLNRWPMWQVSADLIERQKRDVITRLKLALAALAEGDSATLQQQLDRLADEAPLARLAGRLAHELGDDLAERRSDAAGLLAQFVFEPPPHAALIKHRVALAELCRCVAEAEHARHRGLDDAAVQIDVYAHELIRELLALLN